MPDTTEPGGKRGGGAPGWGRRLGWMALIWALSVAALGLIAGLLRLIMNAAGLTI